MTARLHCDRCGPAVVAYVVMTQDNLELHFCNHHYNKHELALLAAGWQIAVDKREEVPV